MAYKMSHTWHDPARVIHRSYTPGLHSQSTANASNRTATGKARSPLTTFLHCRLCLQRLNSFAAARNTPSLWYIKLSQSVKLDPQYTAKTRPAPNITGPCRGGHVNQCYQQNHSLHLLQPACLMQCCPFTGRVVLSCALHSFSKNSDPAAELYSTQRLRAVLIARITHCNQPERNLLYQPDQGW